MAHRAFKDRLGREWEVWEVYPSTTERRVTADAVAVERRQRSEPRASLPDALRHGWLAFESKRERRRFGPPPDGWETMSDLELAELVERAVSAGKTRRLIE